ncbi:phosphatase PAP2 family protein [Blastococcus sp. TF02-9]|uniref:phosphatase PAP2 family protein n=1 Tax=Blastococcus sp. TF02-09 TaxID=2250576 RepID=UPI0011BF1175|nr:phosphatase PAP2 family protein [Blastococcus sp. TF02-9]
MTEVPATSGPAAEHGARRRFGFRALLGLVAVLVGAVPFLVLLLLVTRGWTPLAGADQGIADELNRVVRDSPAVLSALRLVTDLGGTGTAVWLLTLATVVLLVRRRRRLALFTTVTGLGLAVLVPVTKALVDRVRPVVEVPVAATPANASFPSGHATTALVTFGTLTLLTLPVVDRRWRPWLLAAASLVAGAVGITRLALGVHFLSDVLAGWAMGAGWLATTTLAFRAWQHDRGVAPREPLDPLEVPPSPVFAADRWLPDGVATARRMALAAAAAWAAATALGLLVTAVASGTWLGRWDRAVPAGLVELRTPLRTSVAEAVGDLAGTRAIVAVSVTTAVLAVALTRRRRPALFVVVATVGEVLLYAAVTAVVDRARPSVADLTDGLPVEASWPSGHVAAATVVYGAAAVLLVSGRGHRWRVLFGVPAAVVLAVGFSRMYVAAHHPTDVLAGLLLGAAWLAAYTRLLLRPGEHPPTPDR